MLFGQDRDAVAAEREQPVRRQSQSLTVRYQTRPWRGGERVTHIRPLNLRMVRIQLLCALARSLLGEGPKLGDLQPQDRGVADEIVGFEDIRRHPAGRLLPETTLVSGSFRPNRETTTGLDEYFTGPEDRASLGVFLHTNPLRCSALSSCHAPSTANCNVHSLASFAREAIAPPPLLLERLRAGRFHDPIFVSEPALRLIEAAGGVE